MDKFLSSNYMNTIVEFVSDGIYVVDRNGYTIYVNKAYEEISGLKREQIIGKHMSELEEKGIIDESVSLLVLKDKKQHSLVQNIRDNIKVVVSGNPVFDKSGNIDFVVTSVRDVTKLNEITNKLQKVESMLSLQKNHYSFYQDGIEETVIFKSKKMKEIYRLILQVAPYPTSILLTGPTGSGKEVIASIIHNHSDRKDKPFIKVNCGAIPEDLIESEFFGYEAGAFTGARKEGKIGLLELANGGTLLLDEVGEMPLHLQVKFLRVLQDKKIQRVGGTTFKKVDIRIISATNQNLRHMIENKQFREDLYYRLAVLEIKVPPLKERKEDIKELIYFFLEHFCSKYRIDKKFSKEAELKLCSYNWPGNVRELKNTIENLVVSSSHQVIRQEDISLNVTNLNNTYSSLKEQLDSLERKIIKETIETSTSIRKAAKALGIHHATLINKMKKHSLV